MLRAVLLSIVVMLIARALWRVVEGLMEGLSGPRRSRTPERSVHMVRDPVCGTFVLPDRAVTLGDGSRTVFFCSAGCRDKYRARTA